ncbi:TonB-dependent receptor family protein [Pseudoduganella sp. GCM10020061]|uniref:TonB-dependent receptor family protein n=1 Tax=Pseudoduganella sp. GCM10020061 TaxID=3317345 RepID=UPI00363C36B5
MRNRVPLFLLAALPSALAAAQSVPPATVVVTATRTPQPLLDVPAATDVVDMARVEAQLRVNASEALASVPGVVALNRQNYAQDLQISSRGFGARSAFGVRGVRLLADGIPASMPDGQGQAATFNLDMAERIEVLRGPFSALYGNHAGGVIQLFTRDGAGRPTVEATIGGGSDGARKWDINAQGKPGALAYVLDASRFETDGYRDHSAATRDQAFAKLTPDLPVPGRLVITASSLRQKDSQDPLGVTWATFSRDPRAGETDPSDAEGRTYARRYNTRKSIDHQQAGAAYEVEHGATRVHATVYGGNRKVVQYQSFSRAFLAPASHSGGVIDFDRDFYGADVHVTQRWRRLAVTAGIAAERSTDARLGYENFEGNRLGVRGRLRRDETNTVESFDPYLQLEWRSGPWIVHSGLRHSHVSFGVADRFTTNGDDSGTVRYTRTTPVAGVLYKVAPALSLYASAARGFEAPTLNELFYAPDGGFNFNLDAATSRHIEIGAKASPAPGTRVQAALFQAKTRDELVVESSTGGRTSYRNAARTSREGVELSADVRITRSWQARVSASAIHAVYEDGVGSVPAGSRLPGVPKAHGFAEIAWAGDGLSAGVEAQASSRIYTEDTNRERPAPGYGVLNLRANATQQVGPWSFRQFVRVNNVFDHDYAGSVIVGEANRRYYEAAPDRNWMAGFTAAYRF